MAYEPRDLYKNINVKDFIEQEYFGKGVPLDFLKKWSKKDKFLFLKNVFSQSGVNEESGLIIDDLLNNSERDRFNKKMENTIDNIQKNQEYIK